MAINLQSPGIKVTERDNVATIAAAGTTTAGAVGEFSWGPINAPQLVTSENELVKKFGKPSTSNNVDFLCAAGYLAYSSSQYVTRVVGTGALNAASGTALLIENDDAYEVATLTGAGNWIAKYAGALGNSIQVVIATASTYDDASFDAYRSFFDAAPGTSDYAAAINGSNDELHVAVIDKDGKITGTPGTLLEKFEAVSKASDARGIDGGTNYYVKVINQTSKYIRWGGHPEQAGGTNWGSEANGTTFVDGALGDAIFDGAVDETLTGGANGASVTDTELLAGLAQYASKETISLDVLVCGRGGVTVANKAIEYAEARKDCVAVFSPASSDVVNNAGSEAADIVTASASYTTSTYGVFDSNWKYTYDRYNDVYVYVPCNPDVAGCMARVDQNLEPWFSPAGYENGRILNAVRLAWNPNQTDRDTLYKVGINPIFNQPGRGTILFGDKTFTTKKTSMSRINVRRLFITLQSVIGDSANDVLFAQNDTTTRNTFRDVVSGYLRSVQGGRGITDYRVVCDETNNPEDVVNANEFICDIFVRPTASVNFIQLNFTSVSGSAAFAEIGG